MGWGLGASAAALRCRVVVVEPGEVDVEVPVSRPGRDEEAERPPGEGMCKADSGENTAGNRIEIWATATVMFATKASCFGINRQGLTHKQMRRAEMVDDESVPCPCVEPRSVGVDGYVQPGRSAEPWQGKPDGYLHGRELPRQASQLHWEARSP